MAFEELKQRQARVWGSAPFERVADTAAAIHEDLIDRLGVAPGERWLDLATGTGAVAQRAARLGAVVTAQDIAPALVETARQLAMDAGLSIDFQVGDCESLPCSKASFDVVSSAQGVVFAPDHRAVARELARVCRPGGRVGITSWRPGGAIEEFLSLTGKYGPPPPPGAGAPLDWGRREHVEELLGSTFSLHFFDGEGPQFGKSAQALWEMFVTSFGPIKAIAASLDSSRRRQFQEDFVAYFDQYAVDGGVSAPREYLVTIGTRLARDA